jgi:putative ABC transport system permease protein
MNPISRGFRNAFRNGIRTTGIVVILGISIALALSLLIASRAVHDRVASLRESLGSTLLVHPAGSNGLQGAGGTLSADDVDQISAIPHVKSVDKTVSAMAMQDADSLSGDDTLSLPGSRSSDNTMLDTNLKSAVTPASLKDGLADGATPTNTPTHIPLPVMGLESSTDTDGTTLKLAEGRQLTETDTDAALLGTDLAEANGLNVGSTFHLGGKTFHVVGLFDTGTKFGNNSVRIPYSTAAKLAGKEGEVASVSVQVDSLDNVEATKSAIGRTLGEDTVDVTAANPSATAAVDGLHAVEGISVVGLTGSLIAAAGIIFFTMLMVSRERSREIGVLKAVGVATSSIIAQFMTEAATLALFAGLAGVALTALLSNPILHILISSNVSTDTTSPLTQAGGGVHMAVENGKELTETAKSLVGTLQAGVGWETLIIGLAAAVAIAVIGSTVPAWFISKIRPAEVLWSE